jgi:hypothetical protein
LPPAPSSSTGHPVFKIVLGGTAALRVLSGRGGRYFLLMTAPPSFSRRFNWPLAFTVLGLVAIAAGVFVINRCAALPGRAARETVDQLERAGRDLRDAILQITQLQPRVTINDRVYFEQTSPIAELALISRKLQVEHEFLHTWAGSTKRVRLHGTYTAKAGFDLRQEFSVTISPEATLVRLPHAQLLGVEQNEVELLAYENGFWNPISGADVQSELATLGQLARDRAAEQNLAGQAEESFRTQLKSRIGNVPPLHVVFYDVAKAE